MFQNIIARKPCSKLVDGLTTSSQLGRPSFEKALLQHARYLEALQECGCNVEVLDANEAFPDSVFVEDVAVLTPKVAVITRPGAKSRVGEIDLPDLHVAIYNYYRDRGVEEIKHPGTLDGGDVLMVGDHYYIGLSSRTNQEGANQLIAILNKYGMSGEAVQVPESLHLKTSVSYLGNNTLLGWNEFKELEPFKKFAFITVDSLDELYCANSVEVNGTIIMPANNPHTKAKLEGQGLKVREVDTSEFQKLDGGVSCLSLRF
ncbi:hypothetical protein DFA_08514 [Cavenderia fasciculata]|uniref:Dimethylargininase n=1 Tax=Cavenderia fasciculata TaxID=261658 RepID=F4Q2Q1_CACFS|nr:uncharacterized protein DFA_08514 [Cavenderia fasciculata]EGG17518.1 hypothetical protein DFA_08514 [Cavenderia fasciculata]|eukprot:XP_004356002.1 hypothetical protein DFA_08514 [Cavenderia fasciculata]